MVNLVRIDPARHMDRWYSVNVQSSLFDSYVVVCTWGNRKTRYQKQLIIPVFDMADGQKLAAKIIKKKLRKGYSPMKEQ